MKIGIDKIGFYIPPFALDMNTLADARAVDSNKYTKGIGQDKMAVAPITQDVVTLAANACNLLLTEEDKDVIDMVLFGTETGIDHSKSSAVYVQRLLGLSNRVRCVELKHACYGATAALQLAKTHVAMYPHSKVLVLASDIAKYGLESGGEPTQGAGAVALLVSANPRVLVLEDQNSFYTDDVMDFWRPLDCLYPMVDGKFSNEQYKRLFNEVWSDYTKKNNRTLEDFEAICFHLPYSKMGMKAFLPHLECESEETQERFKARYAESTVYNRQIGNVYTASLFISFISLIENSTVLIPGDRIGFYSYGSGAVAEFFTGTLVEGYEKELHAATHQALLQEREMLSMEEYEEMFMKRIEPSASYQAIEEPRDSSYYTLVAIEDGKRVYHKK